MKTKDQLAVWSCNKKFEIILFFGFFFLACHTRFAAMLGYTVKVLSPLSVFLTSPYIICV